MSARIIRAPGAPGTIIRREVIDAAVEAARIVAEARAEREVTLASAREAGFQQGFAEWESAIEEGRKQAAQYTAENERALLRLAVKIAEKIIGEELTLAPNRVGGIVTEALRSISRERQVTLQIGPGCAERLEPLLPRLTRYLPHDCVVRLVESEDLGPGDCRIVSELGTIDARVKTQLSLIENALLQESKE